MFAKLDDTLSSCPALVEELVLFLDAEQAFLAGRFQQHLTMAKMRLFLREIEIHSGSPALAHKLLKAIKNCVKSSAGSVGQSGNTTGNNSDGTTAGTGAFSSVSAGNQQGAGIPAEVTKHEEDQSLAAQVIAAVTPLLRGQPHLLQEFLALFPNQRVETRYPFR